ATPATSSDRTGRCRTARRRLNRPREGFGCVREGSDLLIAALENEGGRYMSANRDDSRSHSITSSARVSIDGGTVSPSALAVLRFSARSNLVGCWIGRSAGLAPLS